MHIARSDRYQWWVQNAETNPVNGDFIVIYRNLTKFDPLGAVWFDPKEQAWKCNVNGASEVFTAGNEAEALALCRVMIKMETA